ncbi:MAG TPA: hypothetical protein VN725_02670 [Rhodanobacteraceae bacterium]|nr:hypothetical protein [Rhodanobacteraceae bacterium]
MNADLKRSEDMRPQRAARRTAIILAIIAAAFFVLSIVQQLVLVHSHH